MSYQAATKLTGTDSETTARRRTVPRVPERVLAAVVRQPFLPHRQLPPESGHNPSRPQPQLARQRASRRPSRACLHQRESTFPWCAPGLSQNQAWSLQRVEPRPRRKTRRLRRTVCHQQRNGPFPCPARALGCDRPPGPCPDSGPARGLKNDPGPHSCFRSQGTFRQGPFLRPSTRVELNSTPTPARA